MNLALRVVSGVVAGGGHRRRPLDRHARRGRRRGRRRADRGLGIARAPRTDGADPARVGDRAAERLARHPFRAARVRHGHGLGLRGRRRRRACSPGLWTRERFAGWALAVGGRDLRRALPGLLGRDLPLARPRRESPRAPPRRPGARRRRGRRQRRVLRRLRAWPPPLLPLDLAAQVDGGRDCGGGRRGARRGARRPLADRHQRPSGRRPRRPDDRRRAGGRPRRVRRSSARPASRTRGR